MRVSLAPIVGLFSGDRCRRCGDTFSWGDWDRKYEHQAWHQEQDVLVASIGATEDELFDRASYHAALTGRDSGVYGYWQTVGGLRPEKTYGRRQRPQNPARVPRKGHRTPPNAMGE